MMPEISNCADKQIEVVRLFMACHASGRFDCFRSNVTSSNQTCYAAARFATFRRQRTTNHTHGY